MLKRGVRLSWSTTFSRKPAWKSSIVLAQLSLLAVQLQSLYMFSYYK
jgi:hypothetical protein